MTTFADIAPLPGNAEQAPKVAAAYDSLAAEYDCHYSSPVDLAENLALSMLLRRHGFAGTTSILDAGCGTGLGVTLTGVEPGLLYVGIDISQGMLAAARQNHPHHLFITSSMESVPPTHSYGAVMSLFAFQYTLDPVRALTALVQAGRRGAPFFLVTSSRRHASRASYIASGNGLPVNGLSAAMLKNLAEVAGLTDVKVRGFNAWGDALARWMPVSMLARYLVHESDGLGGRGAERAWHLLLTGRVP